MAGEEDDVFESLLIQDWSRSPPGLKQEERGTQTPGRPLARLNGMLPCGVSEEPSHLFYGSAGLLLLAPAARPERPGDAMLPDDQLAAGRPRRRHAHSVEASIGQKLQIIGDQFYQEHMLQHRNQRNHRPFWLRVASALYTLLFEREPAARWRGADLR